jgi:hypothetical protein
VKLSEGSTMDAAMRELERDKLRFSITSESLRRRALAAGNGGTNGIGHGADDALRRIRESKGL